MNKIKTKKNQSFFGQRGSEIKDRFIFVEELSDIFSNEGDEDKNLYLLKKETRSFMYFPFLYHVEL